MTEDSQSGNSSFLKASEAVFKNKNVSKLSFYETNMENYSKNQKFNLQKIDPKGILSLGVYGSFSGVIEEAHLFSKGDQTLQISYQVYMGKQWHDQTPQIDDTEGQSHFCEAVNGKVTFSLGFDFLASCMYVTSWPKLILKIKGFDNWGELVTKGYAQINFPTESGQFFRKASIFTLVKNERWYHRWLPFFEPQMSVIDDKQVERVIVHGEGRQSQKIKSLGFIEIRVETLLRNFERLGYR